MSPEEIDSKIQLQQITVSHGFDTYRGGQKQSHFVSANFAVPAELDQRERRAAYLTASKLVSKMAVWTALARGSINLEEANELVRNQTENHDRLLEKVLGVTSAK